MTAVTPRAPSVSEQLGSRIDWISTCLDHAVTSNTVLQDKVMVALTPGSFGLTMAEVVEEYATLPLKDAVLEKWMYSNAARGFRR